MHFLSPALCQFLLLGLTSATSLKKDIQNQIQKPLGIHKHSHESSSESSSEPSPEQAATARPNIVVILTDDQDLHLDSLSFTPHIQGRLIDYGMSYRRHYCTTAVCCPSRASLWTGKLAHNTNVTDLRPPYGGFPIFVQNGHNENYLPVWLQEAGYNTYYTGKMFNAHTVWNYDSPHLKGWTGSDFLLDPYTYDYWNATFQRNQDAPVSHEGEYSTDIVARKGLGFLDEAVAEDKPFFLVIAPIGPHSHISASSIGEGKVRAEIPKAAERHQHLFSHAKVPRTDNFNPDEESGADWIRRQPKLSDEQVDYNDDFYRGRLRALAAVDELVEDVFQKLNDNGILDNTYIFYTSDNGFHIGQHRLQPGKECGYEEDINVPLIIRGPGIPPGQASNIVTAHVDLVPTFLEIASAPFPRDLDGTPIPLVFLRDQPQLAKREFVNVEYWGWALSEGKWGFNGGDDWNILNNTYKALRVIGQEYDLYYSIWCTNEHELYDMSTDPGQLRNLLHPDEATSGEQPTILGLSLDKVIPRLDALLFVLKSCKGSSCSQPWASLHPWGGVSSLKDALSPEYDDFYERQTKVEYSRCELGYIIDAEGPQFQEDGLVYWGGSRWSDWT